MLDRYFIGNKPDTEVLFRPEYHPDAAVTSSELVNPDASNLVALFPPWHGGGRAYDRLVQRLANRDNAVLVFALDDQILTHDSDQVLASFESLSQSAANSINDLVGSERYQKVSLLAASLGTPALAMTASLLDRFDAATMITPGANLADCMWHGIRTQRVRKELEVQGETLAVVDKKWQPIAPVNHVPAMAGKQVRVIVSTTDKVIPARSQVDYVQSLVESGVQPTIETSRLGHYGTIGRFCLTGRLS